MATSEIAASRSRLGADGDTYALAHDAGSGHTLDFFWVASNIAESTYSVNRGFLWFDTSILGAGATINSAYITLHHYVSPSQNNAGQATLHIVHGLWSYSIILVTDFGGLKNQTTSGGHVDYSAANPGDPLIIPLDNTGIGWIDKNWITKFGLRVSGDINDNTPTGYNGYTFYGYGISLTVDWTPHTPTTPIDIIGLEALRNIEMSAQGRFYIDESGNAKYESRFARNA